MAADVAAKAVSTHSRPKAAGSFCRAIAGSSYGFNSQPPEGGWDNNDNKRYCVYCFNSQPPEGGWMTVPLIGWFPFQFQLTAARRRLV